MVLVLFFGWAVPFVSVYGAQQEGENQQDSSPEARPRVQPNIVLIMSDDMGYSDIGCYGSEIETPNLDNLAKHGLRFSQFYNCARCCPTRASLMTGLYPHQAGVGLMTGDRGWPAYQGQLTANCQTIAEALSAGGYQCYLSGKWHLARNISATGDKSAWPLQRGFHKFYGTIIGAGSFFDPATLCRANQFITPDNDPEYRPDDFYYTDAISDNAVRFLEQHRDQRSSAESDTPAAPFFLYVSFTAAHWPLHARPADIEKYRGKYDRGYDAIRQTRFARAVELGVVRHEWELSQPSHEWEKAQHQEWEKRCMEVYAAQIDSMDQGIGRIMDQVRRQGDWENTIFIYLQDNGGCAEAFGRRDNSEQLANTKYEAMAPDDLQQKIWPPMQTRDGRGVRTGPNVMPGPADTFIAYGGGWANASNTPFRFYKHFAHEGGISSPLIIHWPNGLSADMEGNIAHDICHVMDVMPSCLDWAGVDYEQSEARKQNKVQPLEGISLGPVLNGQTLDSEREIAFEHHGNRALRAGKYKIVARERENDQQWHLYDMETDRTETKDLAQQHPEILDRLKDRWHQWSQRVGVQPWPVERKE